MLKDIIKSTFEKIPLNFWLLLLERDCLAPILFLGESTTTGAPQVVLEETQSETFLGIALSRLRNLFPFLTPKADTKSFLHSILITHEQ